MRDIERGGFFLNAQFKKSALELCVLALLAERDMYGYELAGAVSVAIETSEGTIYPLLKRLREQRYVTTYLAESPDGPPRKYYAITQQGRLVKEEWRTDWFAFTAAMHQILGGKHE